MADKTSVVTLRADAARIPKICSLCRKNKHTTAFHKKGERLDSRCKDCVSIGKRERRLLSQNGKHGPSFPESGNLPTSASYSVDTLTFPSILDWKKISGEELDDIDHAVAEKNLLTLALILEEIEYGRSA